MFDFHQASLDSDGEYDEGRIQNYIDGLMAAFGTSAESQTLHEEPGWSRLTIDLGFNYVGVSPAEMTRRDFEEVLFDLFPRKVSCEPDAAESIITELRAFWSFVGREFAAPNAAAMLNVLDDDAVVRLRLQLSSPANWGMAKSMFMMGKQSGFDMTSEEGIRAFQLAYNARLAAGQVKPLPLGSPFELGSPLSHEAVRQKRKDKKRQRQAKKRNRPG